MANVLTEINGSLVISHSPAYGPHPHPKFTQLVPLTGVTHYITENATEYYVCDTCLKPFDGPRSAVSHMSSHSERVKKPRALQRTEIIKSALRAVKRNANLRNKFEAAAEQLNRAGITTIHGKVWTYHTVRSVWVNYNQRYSVRVPRDVSTDAVSDIKQSPSRRRVVRPTSFASNSQVPTNTQSVVRDITIAVNQATTAVKHVNMMLSDIHASLADVQARVTQLESMHEVDVEIIEKAAKFDKMINSIQ